MSTPTHLKTFVYGNKMQLHNNMPSFQLNLAAVEWEENEPELLPLFMGILLGFIVHTGG